MTSKTSDQDIKIPKLKLSSQEDFEPSPPSPFNPCPDVNTPSPNLAFDSNPSASLFSNKNRILINNFNMPESPARLGDETPHNKTRTSLSIAMRQGKTPRRFRNVLENREFSGFTEAISEEVCSSAGFKPEGFEGVSVATPTSGASFLRKMSKKKSFKNGFDHMQTLATEDDDEEIDLFEDHQEIEKEKMKSKGKIIVEKLLKSMLMNIVVGIVTVFALFADDIRLLVHSEVLNLTFDVMTIVTIFIFVLEIGFALYVEEQYLWSMFFWLDIFSTASMFFDIEFLIEDVIPHQANHSTQVAEASRASRIATKQGRVIRIIRLAQLGKLYKQYNQNKVENIQKEFEAQKEAKNLERQNSFQNNQKSLARIHPEPSRPASSSENRPHLTTQGQETHRLLTKTDERLDTDVGEIAPMAKRSGKIAPLLHVNSQPVELEENIKKSGIIGRRSRDENYLSAKLKGLKPEMSQPEQQEEVISQPFNRKRGVKSTILGGKNSERSLLQIIPKSSDLRTEQIEEQVEEKGEVTISQPFNRKRGVKSTILGGKNSEISLPKVISRGDNIKTEQENEKGEIAISQPFQRKRTLQSSLLGSNNSGINISKIFSRDKGSKKISNGGLKHSKTLKWEMSDRSIVGGLENKNEEVMGELAPKELRIGRRLTELTTKRVVFMALALLIVIPLFNASFYFSPPECQEYEMELLGELIDDPGVASGTIDAAIENFKAELSSHHHEPRLVYFKIGTVEYYKDEHLNLGHMKSSGTSTVTIITKNKGTITSIMSIEGEEKIEGWLGIGKIIFICVLLTVFAVLFSKDTDRMILRPLERIVVKMNRLARDPLQAKKHDLIVGNHHHEGFENETIKVENAIVKIGHLLAIGYGELGSRIITHNVSSGEDMSSSTLIGQKQAAIFGFCKINDFVEITEVLQEDVMVFVNSVADIVHSLVDVYQGSVSKNLGDAFFVVWKFPEEDVFDHMNGQIEILNSEQTESLVDCALFSFLKIFAKIHRDPMLNEYKRNESLGIKIPNFETSISLALHAGWAYEGAIGSEYKIDASYVSSDVQIVARLTAAAKKYKVPLVITGSVYLLLSEKVKKYARLIDTVLVKETTEPMDLYTIDVDLDGIEMSEDRRKIEKKEKRKIQEKKKKYIKGVVNEGKISDFLQQDTEIEYMMLRKHDEKFVKMFDSAMDSYIEGEWKASYAKFMKCLEMKGGDGPSLSLINFIEKKHNFVVPEGFEGYRDFANI